jgi:hypothetical protein
MHTTFLQGEFCVRFRGGGNYRPCSKTNGKTNSIYLLLILFSFLGLRVKQSQHTIGMWSFFL